MDHGNDVLRLLTEAGIDLTKAGLKFTTGAMKIQGDVAVQIIKILLDNYLKQQSVLKPGKTNLEKLINSGKELKMTEINKNDLNSFTKKAKIYGITYSVIRDKNKFNVVYTNQDIDRVKAVFESVIASRVNPIRKLVGKVKESAKKIQVNILRKVQSIVEKKLEKMQPQPDIEPTDVFNKGDSVTSHNSKNDVNKENIKNKENVPESKKIIPESKEIVPEKRESINKILESIDIDKINADIKTKSRVQTRKTTKTTKTNKSR